MSNINIDNSWKEEYYNKLVVDLINDLTKEEITLLKKLDIEVENKVYTQADYDGVKMLLVQYYVEEDIDGNIVPPILELKDKGVTQEEYDALIKKFDEIDEKYGIYL